MGSLNLGDSGTKADREDDLGLKGDRGMKGDLWVIGNGGRGAQGGLESGLRALGPRGPTTAGIG